MENTKKTCNLCVLTVVAFGLNILSNQFSTTYLMLISVLLSTLVVVGSMMSKDKGRYIRWFLMAVNGLYVFFFGIIMILSQLYKS